MKIRPIAICLIQDPERDRILVLEGHDPIKGDLFYRPLGGGIEFGERGWDAVIREFQEELGAELEVLRHLATLENIFTYKGRPGHEIVLLYAGRLANPELYERDEIEGQEDNGKSFKAVWAPIPELLSGHKRLVPEALVELLPRWQRAHLLL